MKYAASQHGLTQPNVIEIINFRANPTLNTSSYYHYVCPHAHCYRYIAISPYRHIAISSYRYPYGYPILSTDVVVVVNLFANLFSWQKTYSHFRTPIDSNRLLNPVHTQLYFFLAMSTYIYLLRILFEQNEFLITGIHFGATLQC